MGRYDPKPYGLIGHNEEWELSIAGKLTTREEIPERAGEKNQNLDQDGKKGCRE